MKKPIVAVTFSILATTSFAQSTMDCGEMFTVAEAAARANQYSVPLPEVMSGAEYTLTEQRIIISAFEIPLQSTDAEKNRTALEFGNTVYIECWEYQQDN